MERNDDIFKTIQIEEYIWIIYLVLIGLSFYANSIEKRYYIYNNDSDKSKYRSIIILIFFIALLVYIYFFNNSYNDVLKLKETDSYNKKFFNQANLLASTLIFIAGIIFLFIAIYDTDLDTEIAFS